MEMNQKITSVKNIFSKHIDVVNFLYRCSVMPTNSGVKLLNNTNDNYPKFEVRNSK